MKIKTTSKRKRVTAIFLLVLMTIQTFVPTMLYALSGGPSQPEAAGFAPSGTNEMVNNFTGDFSYNIPLLDVGGYPVNLSYSSGIGMDQEASWVGLGWSLGPGNVTRNMRGLPDDFNGDKVTKEMNMKTNFSVGLKAGISGQVAGFGNIGASTGVTYDNYNGLSTELSASASVSVGNKNKAHGSLGLNIGSNSATGLGISPSIGISSKAHKTETGENTIGASLGCSISTRSGVSNATFGANFEQKTSQQTKKMVGDKEVVSTVRGTNSVGVGGSYSFGTTTYNPSIDIPMVNKSFFLRGSLGPDITVVAPTFTGTGFYTEHALKDNVSEREAYGYMNAQYGKDNEIALHDMNREKDMPFHEKTPALAIPIFTNDLFVVNQHSGVGQYRLFRSDFGGLCDPMSENSTTDGNLGIEISASAPPPSFEGGGDFETGVSESRVMKWDASLGNNFLANTGFRAPSESNTVSEQAYFRQAGEILPLYDRENENKASFFDKIGGDKLKSVLLFGEPRNATSQPILNSKLPFVNGVVPINVPYVEQPILISSMPYKEKRSIRNNVMSYNTKVERASAIQSFSPITVNNNLNDPNFFANNLYSNTIHNPTYHKDHHISEIIVTNADGTRSVFGVPAYIKKSEEVTFSVNAGNSNVKLIGYTPNTSTDPKNPNGDNSIANENGQENYYQKTTTPAYAYSYLQTEFLTADYNDLTGDGITMDDPGNAVKIRYSMTSNDYKYRTPIEENQATLNKALYSDSKDDKASYSFGEKEIWYTHSIESRTMIALFVLEDRLDMLGVINENGKKNANSTQKRLRKIVLYSKSEINNALTANPNRSPIPTKTIHFEYDYNLGANLPNKSSGPDGSGKLTLKEVYFTFGNSVRKINGYKFSYKQQANNVTPVYSLSNYDRWSNYKSQNPSWANGATLDEFPYVEQNKAHADEDASVWNLNEISTPTGGIIHVEYESDDYAYVQNKKAMQMYKIAGFCQNIPTNTNEFDNKGLLYDRANGIPPSVIQNNYLVIQIPTGTSLNDILGEEQSIYMKNFMDLDYENGSNKDFIPSYIDIEDKGITVLSGNTYLWIKMKQIEGENPITFYCWQFIKSHLPKLAYPGSYVEKFSPEEMIKNLFSHLLNIASLFVSDSEVFKSRNYGRKVILNKSWVRLNNTNGHKLGGGCRVKRIGISDNWTTMSGLISTEKDSEYGQTYDYNLEDGRSSGVAEYEPMAGADENPFRQPLNYSQSSGGLFSPTSYHYLEEPFGEALFPSPTVGYSRVTVTNFGKYGNIEKKGLGYTIHEFFTAKDFPIKTDRTGIQVMPHEDPFFFSFLDISTYKKATASQGYLVEVNDMHGKPKKETIYIPNSNPNEKNYVVLDETEYQYNTNSDNVGLNSVVPCINPDGHVVEKTLGVDIDFYSDNRMSEVVTVNGQVQVNVGIFIIGIFPIPWPGMFGPVSSDYQGFRSVVVNKFVHRKAIQTAVLKTHNGSSIKTTNKLWDGITGNVVLTTIQNEYDQDQNNLTYPAHWIYPFMGLAYKNIGAKFTSIATNADGVIDNTTSFGSVAYNMIEEGDELVYKNKIANSFERYWCIKNYRLHTPDKVIIDKSGKIKKSFNFSNLKIVRSGNRNLANTPVGSILSNKSPITNNELNVNKNIDIIQASAVEYDHQWKTKFHCCALDESATEDPNDNEPDKFKKLVKRKVLGGEAGPIIVDTYENGDYSHECINDPLPCGNSNILKYINPILHSMYAMPRPYRSWTYYTTRSNQKGLDLKNEGIFTDFDPFYVKNLVSNKMEIGIAPTTLYPFNYKNDDDPWTWSSTTTNYDPNGNEIENVNPLGKYSAVKYGYKNSMVVAVGNNTEFKDFVFNGFEDYGFLATGNCPNNDNIHFDNGVTPFYDLGHTGSKSLKVISSHHAECNVGLVYKNNVKEKIGFDIDGAYLTRGGAYYTFNPEPSLSSAAQKKYIISAWINQRAVNDPLSICFTENYYDARIKLTFIKSVGPPTIVEIGVGNIYATKIIDNWQKIEGEFEIPPCTISMKIELVTDNYATLFDDIRIFPSNANMKAFVYDPNTLKHISDLDENHFATFYDYDPSGNLVRIRKETERGIMTIKESNISTKE